MEAFRHTMRIHLGAVPSESEWLAGFGTPLRPQLAKFARGKRHVELMASTYRDYNRAHHDRLVRPFTGIREALETLHQRGVQMAIVTSKTRSLALRGLRRCALEKYFEVLVAVEDVTEFKPDPAPVLEALKRVGAAPANALFVGDSPHDVAAGRSAGVKTAAVRWGPFGLDSFQRHPPHYWVSEPREIPALVQ